MVTFLFIFSSMWTGYVVGLNVRLKSLVQLSNTDIENILEKVRFTCVLVSLLHFICFIQ